MGKKGKKGKKGAKHRDVYGAGGPIDQPDASSAWSALQAALLGLLSVDVNPTHAGALEEPTAHRSAWLVLHVRLLFGADLKRRLRVALDALAALFVASERVRLARTRAVALWTRVLSSEMMITPLSSGDPAIARFARLVCHQPMQLLVDCTGMKIRAELLKPLGEFMLAKRARYTRSDRDQLVRETLDVRGLRVRRLAIGLRFARSRMSKQDLRQLETLAAVQAATPQDRHGLVSDTLAQLDFSDSILQIAELDALARVLSHVRVRELWLEAIVDDDEHDTLQRASQESIDALRRVLSAALTGPTGADPNDHALSLWLAGNQFDERHFSAVADALDTATRRLRLLSLAYTLPEIPWHIGRDRSEHDKSCLPLARICFASARQDAASDHRCSELDLSGLWNSLSKEAFAEAVAKMIGDRVPRIQQALAVGTKVHCRVIAVFAFTAPVPSAMVSAARMAWWNRASVDDAESSLRSNCQAQEPLNWLHRGTQYEIVEATDDGWFRLASIDADTPPSWIYKFSVEELSIGSADALRPRFNSFVLGGAERARMDVSTLPDWLIIVGRNARKLSVRWTRDLYHSLELAMACCPELVHLDIEGSMLHNTNMLWEAIRVGTCPKLQSINYNGNGNGLREVGARQMQRFRHAMAGNDATSLRHIALCRNELDLAGLESVRDVLRENKTLELVELDSTSSSSSTLEYAQRRREMNAELHNKVLRVIPLPVAARAAFMSVVAASASASASHATDIPVGLDAPVCSLIFEFAAHAVVRQLLWVPEASS